MVAPLCLSDMDVRASDLSTTTAFQSGWGERCRVLVQLSHHRSHKTAAETTGFQKIPSRSTAIPHGWVALALVPSRDARIPFCHSVAVYIFTFPHNLGSKA